MSEEPPNLRYTDENCRVCKHSYRTPFSVKCQKYDVEIDENNVCDDFEE